VDEVVSCVGGGLLGRERAGIGYIQLLSPRDFRGRAQGVIATCLCPL
jgi:hypothetical protein